MKKIALLDSSSTKLAALFSALMLVAVGLLAYELYALVHGSAVNPAFNLAILSIMLLTSVGLFIVSYYVTKRINTIAATADRIMQTRDLSQRIPIDSRWDDLSKLSTILNHMLDEIEQLVTGVKQVSDNIAHDLRTPLTRLRNRIETLRGEATSEPMPINQLIHECDALLSTFNALLRISNIEAGKRYGAFQALDIARVAQDVVELYEPLAMEKEIVLTLDSAASHITGDKDLLFQALANLVDNAIKYTPIGGSVRVSVTPLESCTSVTVTDSGVGIPDEHKPHVFRRFYRVDSARAQSGSGLGLSLVAAIIKLHHGAIELNDNKPSGLSVKFTL